MSPTPEILFKMLDLPSDGKPWKMKKIAREDFCNTIGDVEASVGFLDSSFNAATMMQTKFADHPSGLRSDTIHSGSPARRSMSSGTRRPTSSP